MKLLAERCFDAPRPVEIENDGRWWSGWQYAWRLCDEQCAWMATVWWTEQHDGRTGNYYMSLVAAEPIRLTWTGPAGPRPSRQRVKQAVSFPAQDVHRP